MTAGAVSVLGACRIDGRLLDLVDELSDQGLVGAELTQSPGVMPYQLRFLVDVDGVRIRFLVRHAVSQQGINRFEHAARDGDVGFALAKSPHPARARSGYARAIGPDFEIKVHNRK
jgi:hypothetical protein